jgi:hypothetical protein
MAVVKFFELQILDESKTTKCYRFPQNIAFGPEKVAQNF